MDRLIYTAMAGAKHTMQAQARNSHNLANVSTTGFRAELLAFEDVPMSGPGYHTRAFSGLDSGGSDLTPGPIHTTGRNLDVAVNGDGWIVVQAPGGDQALTRAGDLRLNSARILTTGAGHPVMGSGGAIAVPPAETIEIGADGTLSIRPLGEAADTLVQVDRIQLVNPESDRLEKGLDGLMRVADGAPVNPDASVRLTAGAIESSNVNAVDALVDMISLSRHYELQVKLMRAAQDNDASMNRVMSIS